MPLVTVILPVYNEAAFVSRSLASLLAQDYAADRLEIIVVDGMSTDETAAIVRSLFSTNANLRLVSNPARIVAAGMNLGIKAARGEIIVRVDAHADFGRNYVSLLVRWLMSTGADNVGGVSIVHPVTSTVTARAIALALVSPFGVGNSAFRIGVKSVTEVDTVPFGCYRRAIFNTVGLFDERLERNQDIEFNSRVRAAGGRILLIPEITWNYFARATYRSLWKNNSANGYWVVRTVALTRQLRSHGWRHFVPLAFVGYLLLLGAGLIALPLHGPAGLIPVLPLALYVIASGWIASTTASRERDFRLMPALMVCFGVLHVSYGIGSLSGLLSLTGRKGKNVVGA